MKLFQSTIIFQTLPRAALPPAALPACAFASSSYQGFRRKSRVRLCNLSDLQAVPHTGSTDGAATGPRHSDQPITAVVMGSSVAGMLAAAALSGYVETVIVEKDDLDELLKSEGSMENLQQMYCNGSAGPYVIRARQRAGVPQFIQLHGLLGKGAHVVEGLLPGWLDSAQQLGGHLYQPGKLKTFYRGRLDYHPDVQLDFETLACTRDVLETSIRRRLLALRPTVRIRSGAPASGLLWSEDRSCVQGVLLKDGEAISADLVIDASGRRSALPAWLQGAGYEAPDQVEVDSGMGYAMRLYKMPEEEAQDDSWHAIFVRATPPAMRGAIVMKVEGGKYIAGAMGFNWDHPPSTAEGLDRYLQSIDPPLVWQKLAGARPLMAPRGYAGTTNLRSFWERARLPAGLAVIGDAVAAFNPIYGQGCTVSALEAEALSKLLQEQVPPGGQLAREQVPDLAAALQQAVGRIVNFPFDAATGEDFAFPGTKGQRPHKGWAERAMDAYIGDLFAMMSDDSDAFRALTPVFHMMRGPESLLTPSLIGKVAASRARRILGLEK